jgi:hypothetical protein
MKMQKYQLRNLAPLHLGRGSTRIELECQHQHGLLYVVEGAEMNWVCSNLGRPVHSLAGFFKELTELKDARVRELMQRWGLYFRPLPLVEGNDAEEAGGTTVIPLETT